MDRGLFSRRDLLRMASLAVAPLFTHRAAGQGGGAGSFPGMIIRMESPRNLETPPGALNENLPAEHFFIRSHFALPKFDVQAFKLVVEGHVANRLELTLEDLKKMPVASKSIALECAGNGRIYLVPQARGLQWGDGAVGAAVWGGVPLGAVLERARIKPGAVDVVLTGADSGAIASDPPSPGPIHFDRGIPLSKAVKDETLLAWDMNKSPLPASHGAPLRAVVGGWYGMASVKWLNRIVVTDKPHAGFWQTMDYSIWDRAEGRQPQLTAVTAMQPKAVITSPALDDLVKAGQEYTVSGMAWAGEAAVQKVEFSTDGGKTWQLASLGEKAPFTWTSWRIKWTAPRTPGAVKLLARCTDARGATQPESRDPDRRTYMINHLAPVEVLVR